MSIYTLYIHTISGDIATLNSWRADYESMDVESWHGKPAEECIRDNWIEDGALQAIQLLSDDAAALTNRIFQGWFGEASEGDIYQSEWACGALDADDNSYEIVWSFPVVKGEEPEDDCLPWEDEAFIDRIKTL